MEHAFPCRSNQTRLAGSATGLAQVPGIQETLSRRRIRGSPLPIRDGRAAKGRDLATAAGDMVVGYKPPLVEKLL